MVEIRIHVLRMHGNRCSGELQFGLRTRRDVTQLEKKKKKKMERKLSGGRRISFLAWNYPFHRADSGPWPLPVAIAFYGFRRGQSRSETIRIFLSPSPTARRDR